MAGLIDPTVTGKYPVILGDSLLGKGSNEIFTSVRYNHKPSLSSDEAPNHARLKPSVPGKTSSYDLSFDDNGSKYSFAGARKTDDDQYVLYFDAERKAFILDKVDSTFDMNVTRVPGNSDPDDLRKQYPHLKNKTKSTDKQSSSKSNGDSSKPKSAAAPKKAEKKQEAKREALAMPAAKRDDKPKKKSQFADDDDEEEEEDDDGGLLIEYPGGNNAPPKEADFSPAFPTQRRFDEYMDQQESGADDADAESDEDPDLFKLPSPVKKPAEQQDEAMPDAQDDGSADLEAALEAEMKMAFEDLANSQEEGKGGDESEISEED